MKKSNISSFSIDRNHPGDLSSVIISRSSTIEDLQREIQSSHPRYKDIPLSDLKLFQVNVPFPPKASAHDRNRIINNKLDGWTHLSFQLTPSPTTTHRCQNLECCILLCVQSHLRSFVSNHNLSNGSQLADPASQSLGWADTRAYE